MAKVATTVIATIAIPRQASLDMARPRCVLTTSSIASCATRPVFRVAPKRREPPVRGTSPARPASSICRMRPPVARRSRSRPHPTTLRTGSPSSRAGMVGMLVREAGGQWWFTDEGTGTHVKWTYTAEPRTCSRCVMLFPVIRILWNRYMRNVDAGDQDEGGKRNRTAGHGGGAMTQWDFDLVNAARAAGDDRPRTAPIADPGTRRSARPSTRTRIADGASGQSLVLCRCSGPRSATRGEACSRVRTSSGRRQPGPWIRRPTSAGAPDGKGWRRIIAPNGICVLGTWEITETQPVHRLLRPGIEGADHRPVLVRRQRDQARSAPVRSASA